MYFQRALVLSALLSGAYPAFAIDTIDSPNLEKGELAFEYSGNRTFDGNSEKNNIQEHELTVGYTPTDRWGTEITGVFDKEPGQSAKMTGVGWQNTFQFFEHGENWLDSGMSISYTLATQSHTPDEVEAKLLLEKEWGGFIHIANIGLTQEVGHDSAGGPDRFLQWSSRYHYRDYMEPGFELQSDFGQANEHLGFQEQEHYIGPAVYGEITEHIGYEAAYLFGVTDASSQSAVKLQLEYHVNF